MNIFEIYLNKIQDLILVNSKILKIENNISFLGTLVETPPQKINFDLSSNIALVLAKKTKQSPIVLAENLKKIMLDNLDDFSEISVAKPGFINFRFSTKTYQKLIINMN